MESITSLPSHNVLSGSFSTPLLISVIGIISTSLALLVYHYILVKFCFRRQQAINNRLDPQSVRDRPLPTGVDKKILETIPIISYSREEGHLFRVDQSECVVCLGELEHGEMVRLLPPCKHAFHVPCIDQWFVAHTSCPVCRSPMVTPATNDPAAPPAPRCVDDSRMVQPPPEQEQEHGVNVNAASSSGQQSCNLLRHCASLVFPADQRPSRRQLITGLKRSLSLDQSSVIIEIERETSGRDCSSSSSSKDDSVTRRLYRARSMKQLDRVFRSFSRLRTGRNSEILPY